MTMVLLVLGLVHKNMMIWGRLSPFCKRSIKASTNRWGSGSWPSGCPMWGNPPFSTSWGIFLTSRTKDRWVRWLPLSAPLKAQKGLKLWRNHSCIWWTPQGSLCPVSFLTNSGWNWHFLASSRNKLLKKDCSWNISISFWKESGRKSTGRL